MTHSPTAEHYDGNSPARFLVRRSTVVLCLFAIYVIGSHLRLSLYWGGSMLIPMYPMLLSAAGITLLFANRLLDKVGLIFVVIFAFIMVQPLLSSAPGASVTSGILGRLQLVVSMISAFALLVALPTIETWRLRKFVLMFWALMISLAVIESLGMKAIFDQARDLIYSGSGRGVYESGARDVAIYGKVRPTAFASEPSFLTDTLASLALLFFFLSPNRGSVRSWVELLVLLCVSFMVSPSFKILFYFVAVLAWEMWPTTKERAKIFVAIWSSSLLVFFVFKSFFMQIFASVFSYHLVSGSFFGRMTVGRLVAEETLSTYPLFGYGVGNEDGVYPIIADIWQSTGAFSLFPWYIGGRAVNLMSSGFWWQFVFLGVVGTVVFVCLLAIALRKLDVKSPMRTIFCTWIIWYGGSAFVDPRSWFIVVLFAIGALVKQSSSQIANLSAPHQHLFRG